MARAPRLEVFVVVKGHAFSRDAFEAMLRAIDVEPTMVDQPAAAMLLNPDAMRRYDAILFYDMPGMDFRAPIAERPAAVPPDPVFVAGFEALLSEGKGIVALHHAIAGWPAWPAYAEALGGAFLYKPKSLRGGSVSDSGFAADVEYEVRLTALEHPVLAGVPKHFTLCDELYLNTIFEDSIEPLLMRAPVEPARFQSATRAVRRIADSEGETWVPPTGSDVIGWVKAAGNSPLVYFQPGDGPATYADPNYQLLVGNALRWVASQEARAWVRARK